MNVHAARGLPVRALAIRARARVPMLAGALVATGCGGGPICFERPVYYPTGGGALEIGVADLDGDGRPEVVSLDRRKDQFTVLPNVGSGAFGTPRSIPTGPQPGGQRNFVVTDLDGDGAPDVLTGYEMSLFRNLGRGAFAEPVQIDQPYGAYAVISCDLNGDRRDDLIVFEPYRPGGVLLNQGGARFAALERLPGPGYSAMDARCADLDADGDLDVAVVGEKESTSPFSGTRVVEAFARYRGDGSGTLRETRRGEGGDSVRMRSSAVADFDGDGQMDRVGVYSGEVGPTVSFSSEHPERYPGTPRYADLQGGPGWDVAAPDLDGDGHPDVVVRGLESIDIWRGRGDGTFDPPQRIPVPPSYFLAIADLDGDGRPDIATTYQGEDSHGVAVLLNRSQ